MLVVAALSRARSDGDKRFGGREEEFCAPFKSGDVLSVCVDLGRGTLRFSRNGAPLGEAFAGLEGPLVPAVTLASEESKVREGFAWVRVCAGPCHAHGHCGGVCGRR